MTIPDSRIRQAGPILLFVLVTAFVLELTIGAVWIAPGDVLRALAGGSGLDSSVDAIIHQFRLPRAWTGLLAGAALGTAGLLLQTVFRNPLADPHVLGLVQGGQVGVAVVVVFSSVTTNAVIGRMSWLGDVGVATAAWVGAVAVLLLMLAASRRVNTITLLILGLMLGYFATGVASLVIHFTDEDQAAAYATWADGNFAGITAQQLRILAPLVIAGLAAAHTLVKPLNALLLGEQYARSLGVGTTRARYLIFGTTALLAGSVTAYCGPIAFLGIIAAHLSRVWLRTSDHKILVPGVALIGATFALVADLVTHLPWSKHYLHLNAVNGLVGAPIVAWMIWRKGLNL